MIMEFVDKEQFLLWISKNVKSHEGIWIRFIKDKRQKRLSAEEALDVSLCYGWIDGQMISEGANTYIKYFAPRTENSKWSKKNTKSIERLRKNKQMTKYGEEAIEKAIKNGQWEKEKTQMNFDALFTDFTKLLENDEFLLSKFNTCTVSVKKRFCGFYFDAKAEETKKKRLEKIKIALNENNKGMLF